MTGVSILLRAENMPLLYWAPQAGSPRLQPRGWIRSLDP